MKKTRLTRIAIIIIFCVNLLGACNLPLRPVAENHESQLTLTGTLLNLPEEKLSISILNPENNAILPTGSQLDLQVLIKGAPSSVSIAFWNNGNLIGEMNNIAVELQSILTFPWTVQPEPSTIAFIISTQNGIGAVSNAVTIYPSAPSPGLTLIPAQETDTRQSLSEQYGLPIEDVVIETLPGFNPDEHIPSGTLVTLNLAVNSVPVSNTPSLPVGFVPTNLTGDSSNTPSLSGIISSNGIELSFSSPSHEVQSLILYRSNSSSGRFEPIFNQAIEEPGLTYQFVDQIGEETRPFNYFVMGLSENSATPGNIFQPNVNVPAPAADLGSAIPTPDGNLHIMDGTGIVYFYASINQSQAVRVPELGFIQVDDGLVNLNKAFEQISADAQFPILLDAEVWTWTGETAKQIGNLHTWLEKTTLAVCVDGNQRCGGIGSGEFHSRELTEAIANTDIAGGTDFDFPWKTSLLSNPDAVIQVSLSPFTEQDNTEPADLVYSAPLAGQCTETGCGSVFTIEFADLLKKPTAGTAAMTNTLPFSPDSPVELSSSLLDYSSISEISQQMFYGRFLGGINQVGLDPDFHQYGQFILYPIDFYVRVIPIAGGQPSGSPSNTVHIIYGPMGTSATPEYFPTVTPPPQPQQIYTARLIEFVPLIPPSLDWGCVYITNVESYAFNYAYFEQLRVDHKAYCPSDYKGVGEPSWYESFWDFATGAVDWISEKYNEMKAAVVSEIAGALESAGLCDNCEAYVSAALSAGMIALGIPPELPDFSKLTDAGIDYLVTEVAESMGVPCDATCKEIIRDGINQLADDMKAQAVSSYTNEEEAHNHGKNPLFIPAGVSVEPATESNWQTATLRIQVSRKPGTENISAADLANIVSTLYVTFDGYNDRTGQSYTVYNCWSGGCDLINPSPDCQAVAVPGCPESRPVTGPLEGQLFNPYIITIGGDMIAHLQPGETKDLELALIPSVFWIPGHEDETTYSWYDDWGYLYEGGTGKIALDMNAMACNENIMSQPPNCSYTLERTDYWEIGLPSTSTWGYNQMWSGQ